MSDINAELFPCASYQIKSAGLSQSELSNLCLASQIVPLHIWTCEHEGEWSHEP